MSRGHSKTLKEVATLYTSYDGSIPWMEFVCNNSAEHDVRLRAALITHIKDQASTWVLFTVWAPFMEKTPLVDEIWQFWRAHADAEDLMQLDAGEREITQIDQLKGEGEYWIVDSRYRDREDRWMTPLKRVNGVIMAWRDEEEKQ